MSIASIHIEKGHIGEFFHNDRSKPTVNSIFDKGNNVIYRSADEALKLYYKELEERSKRYYENTGQKLQKKAITLLSAVVNIKPDTSIDDLKKLAKKFEEEFGTKVLQIAIHRDEGHIDENNNPIINHHAHIMFIGLDENGKSVKRKFTFTKLREMQEWSAQILGMQRGKKRKIGERKRLNTYEYKKHKSLEQQEISRIKGQDLTKSENIKLKLDNKKKEKTIKELKDEISALRKEMIKSSKFRQEDYKILSALKKELKASTIDNVYDKFIEFKKDVYAKIKEKDDLIQELQYENEKLEEENELITKELEELELKHEELKENFLSVVERIKELEKQLSPVKTSSINTPTKSNPQTDITIK